jgi:hypothetical protein
MASSVVACSVYQHPYRVLCYKRYKRYVTNATRSKCYRANRYSRYGASRCRGKRGRHRWCNSPQLRGPLYAPRLRASTHIFYRDKIPYNPQALFWGEIAGLNL